MCYNIVLLPHALTLLVPARHIRFPMLGLDMLGLIPDFVSQCKYLELFIPSLECDKEATILPLHASISLPPGDWQSLFDDS